MDIIVNGQVREVDDNLDVARALEALGFGGRRVAVELNQEIIPRDRYAAQRLRHGDRLEIVQAIGGGQDTVRPLVPAGGDMHINRG